MRTVPVNLDPGLRLRLAVGVSADMRTPVDDEHPLAELSGHALGNRQTEKSGTDDHRGQSDRKEKPSVA